MAYTLVKGTQQITVTDPVEATALLNQGFDIIASPWTGGGSGIATGSGAGFGDPGGPGGSSGTSGTGGTGIDDFGGTGVGWLTPSMATAIDADATADLDRQVAEAAMTVPSGGGGLQLETSGVPRPQPAPRPTPVSTTFALAPVESEGPFARWLRQRGVGEAIGQIPFDSRAARYLQSQYGRAQDLRDVQVPLYEDLGLPTRLPYEYATAFGSRAARNQQGRNVLSTFLGMTPQQRSDLGYTFEPYYDVDQTGLMGGRGLETLQGLIQQGRSHLGRSTAGDYLAGRVPFMLSQWETLQPSVGGRLTPFVDYLKSRFGL